MTIEQEAIEFFLKEDVLTFGDFTLKSGRKSPYFFNTGSLCSAQQLAKMGQLYARKLANEPAFADARSFLARPIRAFRLQLLQRLPWRIPRAPAFAPSATARKPRRTATPAHSSVC
jgi:hypothetical protein